MTRIAGAPDSERKALNGALGTPLYSDWAGTPPPQRQCPSPRTPSQLRLRRENAIEPSRMVGGIQVCERERPAGEGAGVNLHPTAQGRAEVRRGQNPISLPDHGD